MSDLKDLNNLIFECSINLEKTELKKQQARNLIDKILNNDSLHTVDKIRMIKQAWVIYKDYDDIILPLSLNNLKEANKILQELKK